MSIIIKADIRGKDYFLKHIGQGDYEWVGLRDNATKLTYSEAEAWINRLKTNHCGWPLEIINL